MTTTPAALLSISQVGEILGVSRVTAYRLVSRGEFPHIQVGRRRLVEPEALQAFIDNARFGMPSAVHDNAPAGNRREVSTSTAAVGRDDVLEA